MTYNIQEPTAQTLDWTASAISASIFIGNGYELVGLVFPASGGLSSDSHYIFMQMTDEFEPADADVSEWYDVMRIKADPSYDIDTDNDDYWRLIDVGGDDLFADGGAFGGDGCYLPLPPDMHIIGPVRIRLLCYQDLARLSANNVVAGSVRPVFRRM